MPALMETGTIVEFIEKKNIFCAVVVQTKNDKVRLLTENNREVSLAAKRLFCAQGRLDPGLGRERVMALLGEIARNREQMAQSVNVEELWEILHTESEWIDAQTMASFAFSGPVDADHTSAVIRAFFADRIYFKFDITRFFPHTTAQVENLITQAEKEAERRRLVDDGAAWIRKAIANPPRSVPDSMQPVVEILKQMCIFEDMAPEYAFGRQILSKAGLDPQTGLFDFLVSIGEFSPHENIGLKRLEIPTDFSWQASQTAVELAQAPVHRAEPCERRDLTGLAMMTIDGQATLDFDDAISLEEDQGITKLGIHIADVAYFIKKDDPIDQEAASRGTSIYMPDHKIPMLPPVLAEGLLSLKAGQVRPAISIMARLDSGANILDYEIFPSLIRIRRQLTYHEANLMAGADKEVIALAAIAEKLKQKRLANNALIISLPEVTIWLDEKQTVSLHRINRESVSRNLVSELMIMANSLMADFLDQHRTPAVFRSQPEPKRRLFAKDEGSLFENWMQRRHLARFVLSPWAEPHSGLGVPAYVTATSPIRKYFDLVTQRQVRGVLGIEKAYSQHEIEQIIAQTQVPLSKAGRLSTMRHRYWILTHLQSRIGEKEEAMVLEQRRDRFVVLLTDLMIEATLSASGLPEMAPETIISVRIDKVDPRNQVLKISAA